MTTSALILGSALIAFAPTTSILFAVTYSKSQLIIVVTTSAFCFLIAALFSSICYMILPKAFLSMTVPSIFCQAFARIQFVKFYIKVEGAIIQAMENHRREHTSNTNSSSSDNDGGESLTLAMNDWTSGLAAGVGYGFMHAILMCGTLLASEARDDAGVLYQDSCQNIPSVLNTSFMAMLFSVLDVVIMLLYFYAVRRKAEGADGSIMCTIDVGHDRGAKAASANAAIIAALIAHTSAAFASWLNGSMTDGCYFALPLVAAVVWVLGVFFCMYVMPFYLPASQRRQIESRMD